MTRGIRPAIAGAVVLLVVALTGVPARADIADKHNDYNGDGISDLVAVRDADDCLYRWNGRPGGGFAPADLVGCGWSSFKAALSAPGDLDRDGIGDLVSVDPATGCMFRWLGTGTGGFSATAPAASRPASGWSAPCRSIASR